MKIRAALAALLLVFHIQPSFAGTTTGQVMHHFTYQLPGIPPLFFVHISSSAANPASCGTTTMNSNRWVTRADTPAGKAHIMMLITAKLTGKPVTVWGKANQYTNPCEDWGDTEGIHAVFSD